MGWPQIVSGALLVAVLLGVAVGFAWSQARALRRLTATPELPDDERRRQRGQAWRRLAGAGLLFVLAGMLAWALLFLEDPAQHLADLRDGGVELNDEQRDFGRRYGAFWIAFLLILLVLLVLAGYEAWSVRRYALREHRKLQADRRAMIQRQVNRLRRERDGSG
jgi:MFS family permease